MVAPTSIADPTASSKLSFLQIADVLQNFASITNNICNEFLLSPRFHSIKKSFFDVFYQANNSIQHRWKENVMHYVLGMPEILTESFCAFCTTFDISRFPCGLIKTSKSHFSKETRTESINVGFRYNYFMAFFVAFFLQEIPHILSFPPSPTQVVSRKANSCISIITLEWILLCHVTGQEWTSRFCLFRRRKERRVGHMPK